MSLFSKYIKDIGAFAVGGVGGVLGYEKIKSIGAQGKRNKDYLNDAYATAKQRMKTAQSQGTESNLESLNARGLLGSGVGPIRAAMLNGTTPGATDLASASRSRLAGEYGLDRHSLDQEHERDLQQNKADTTNAYIGYGTQAVGQAVGAMTGGIGMDAANTVGATMPSASPSMTPIRSAMLSGGSWQGIHPNDPLGESTSAWHTPHITIDGGGMSNSSFNDSGL